MGDENLSEEVRAFASQLGLAGASENGAHDADFRPEVANTSIRKSIPKEKGKAQREKKAPMKERDASKRGYSRPGAKTDAQAPVKGRAWKFGAGIRPGEKAGKSLLGRDEPTVWYEALEAAAPSQGNSQPAQLDDSAVESLRNEADAATANEALVFEQNLSKNRSDSRWLRQVKQSGTTSDRLAAMTLLLQESVVANMKSLDELLRWVGKRSGARDVAAQAIDALRELFTTVLLPDRKLLFFQQQPLSQLPEGKEQKRLLMYYYAEDGIKKRYIQFVKALQDASRDNLQYIKDKASKAIYELLRSKPEQEAVLLAALVDKLGDPSRKTASHAGYLLGQLLEEHPAMNMVVAQETERFMFRPHLPARALYYAVVFLNQIVLSKRSDRGGSALAKKLINIYFTLFQLILEGKVGRTADKLEAEKEKEKKPKKNGQAHKKKHSKRQAAQDSKKPHGAKSSPATQAGEVDAKLLGALLAGVRRAFPFVDPVDSEELMQLHSTALFRVMHSATFGVAVQALSLLFQLLNARSAISDRFYRALYGMMLSPDVARSNKSSMFLSLLFKAMKVDVSDKRILAFMKRLLQVSVEQMPNFACGCLLLISEVLKVRPTLWGSILEAEDADDGLEHFKDQPDGEATEAYEASANDAAEAEAAPSEREADGAATSTAYDMSKRDPLYCRAELTCLWELVLFAGHVHPSVAAMARSLLAGVPTDYMGDPMRDLSTSAFLDKFMQKKPKAQAKGGSLMQPIAKPSATENATAEFEQVSARSAAPDVAYFHKFYEVKSSREAAGLRPKSKRKKRGADDEDAAPLDGSDDDGSIADSEALSDEMDEALDGEEELEDIGDSRMYDELEAAMRADAAEVVARDSTEAELPGSDPEVDAILEGDSSEAEEAGSESGSELFGDEDISESDEESDVPEDVDVFALASGSEAGSESGDDEADSDGEGNSDSEWILAEGAKEFLSSAAGTKRRSQRSSGPQEGQSKRAKVQKGKGNSSGADVFASAEDYAKLLDEDALPDARPASKPNHRQKQPGRRRSVPGKKRA